MRMEMIVMSKNIEEVVDGVIPQDINNFLTVQEKASWHAARMMLKQALTDKVLVVPMSLNDIMVIILDCNHELGHQAVAFIANKIHSAQFGGNK